MREKPCLLNNIADAAAELDGIPLDGGAVAHNDLAISGNEQPIDELEQGGFATAAATEEDQGLAGIDRKIDSTNKCVMDATVNAVCYVLKLNGRVKVLWDGFRVH